MNLVSLSSFKSDLKRDIKDRIKNFQYHVLSVSEEQARLPIEMSGLELSSNIAVLAEGTEISGKISEHCNKSIEL